MDWPLVVFDGGNGDGDGDQFWTLFLAEKNYFSVLIKGAESHP